MSEEEQRGGPIPPRGGSDRELGRLEQRERLELWSTLILALASILTAWSVFQSAKWSGREAIALGQASAARSESVKASTLADQQAAIDVTLFVQWLQALAQEHALAGLRGQGYAPTPDTVSGFLFQRFRPEFRPAVSAWLATRPADNPNAPSSPFVMKQYRLAARTRADQLDREGEQRMAEARRFVLDSDGYVATTVVFAIVLFFAAVGSKLEHRPLPQLMLAAAIALLIGGGVAVACFPVALF